MHVGPSIACLLAMIGIGASFEHAAAADLVPTEGVDSAFVLQQKAVEILHPTDEAPIRTSVLDADAGSHIEILYESSTPVPVAIGPTGAPEHAMMYAVLPPSTDGDVILPLMYSTHWHPWSGGAVLRIYWREDSPPNIIGSRALDRASVVDVSLSIFSHLWDGEPFGSLSINYLFGYRIAGMPVAMIGFVVTVIGTAIFRRRYGSTMRAAEAVCLAVVLTYHARFVFDVAVTEAQEQRLWLREGAYGEMGQVYAIIERVREEGAKDATLAVAACTRLATPLRYFLHPIPVTSEADVARATYGIFDLVWEDGRGMFTCNGVRRSGEVILRFENGDALVRFTPMS